MKIAACSINGRKVIGVATEQGLNVLPISLKELFQLDEEQMKRVIAQGSLQTGPEDEIQYEPCVPKDAKIICVGLNYLKHAIEAGMAVPDYPILFNKFANSLAGHGTKIKLPPVAANYDYEAELGVVIGKRAKYVSQEEALDYVFGYCNVNDLSARDLQMRTGQWMLGKALDGFCPIGPYLVTADEVGDPNQLEVRLELNGEVRQHSNTRDMIFPVSKIISYVSQYLTLEPGDVILTGTPEGVIAGYEENKREWLKPDDVVSVEIEKLGRLTNRLVAE